MFIELIDALRCPNQHEESWLVLAASRMEHRYVVTGTLGCPVCLSEFPIENGVADFRLAGGSVPPRPDVVIGPDDAMRLAALLDLADATGFAVLLGGWGKSADALHEIVETPLLLVDPPETVEASPGISVVRCDGHIPVASGAARGVACDSAQRVEECARIAKARGRLVAPASTLIPFGANELARDSRLWVAEVESVSSRPVALHVRRATQ
jgi:uncharacterized protein YbaR (Trm112 family)